METLQIVQAEAAFAGLLFGAVLALIASIELGKMLPSI